MSVTHPVLPVAEPTTTETPPRKKANTNSHEAAEVDNQLNDSQATQPYEDEDGEQAGGLAAELDETIDYDPLSIKPDPEADISSIGPTSPAPEPGPPVLPLAEEPLSGLPVTSQLDVSSNSLFTTTTTHAWTQASVLFSKAATTSDDKAELLSLRLFDHDHLAEAARTQGEVHFQFSNHHEDELLFQAHQADVVIPCPGREKSHAFFFCLRTGEEIYATADDILSEQDIYNHWRLVEEADYEEITAFVGFDCFKATHVSQADSDNVIDGTWVRKWKHTKDHGWFIKSRLCGRGFLDRQRFDVQRHSSTASRLSQRMILSIGQQMGLDFESLDVSNAFLQGLRFDQLEKCSKKLGIEINTRRRVFFRPPSNVWRHLKNNPVSKINIALHMMAEFLLLLLKPVYGLVDGPLLFQLALCLFAVEQLHATVSIFDDNFFYWSIKGEIVMMWTVHVDDILMAAKRAWAAWAHAQLQQRFGPLKRQLLPFKHIGMQYERLPNGTIFVHQSEFVKGIKQVPMSKQRKQQGTQSLTTEEIQQNRSLLASLLWATQTREDIYCDTVQLQQKQLPATVADLVAANTLLARAQKCMQMMGLHFPLMEFPCRIVSIADSSHGNKMTSYAQEAGGVFLMEDRTALLNVQHGIVDKDSERLLGGVCHRLACQSKKSKRISHSTSHAETLSAVSTLQHAQLIALRYTEVLTGCTIGMPKPLEVLMNVNNTAAFVMPIDHYTDCYDLFQLTCGLKGVPTDKTQRLAVLSIREDRISGRVRNFIHVPTNCMVMDGLTKAGTFPELMRLISSGEYRITTLAGKCVSLKCRKRQQEYTEDDLVRMHD